MISHNTSRRLAPRVLSQDIESYQGLQQIPNFMTVRPEATPESIQKAYETMLDKQSDETAKQVLFKAAAIAAREAEWDFHNAILAMKEAVRGQFGSDSDQAAAVGFKKKSERKRPVRTKRE